ncbi:MULTISPECIES: sensor histidine kinase [Micromonospora]|uniref:sensor histidine kinase n=1 Tax=Micromonospora TaxID=1873 RepID=UPI00112AFC45|nr:MULTISPECIES: nitrate- and nitrite sensing domain-containing protein [unclassified Micromonospora]MCK1805846.1 nitrate- and nitrite sensing domain-containing protein [Micromonospora sp. R42106]MCK1831650.1 nitrate- and nitrite sensing domain-containing protein [Micromonospora sp. R42003]MCK1846148.1 nitrate- and nitrite sensing domain-containing protein [Micromonospora sp. R42004]NHO82740.1 HAMP domain-containing protein [Micromonospora sp. CMU55-4]
MGSRSTNLRTKIIALLASLTALWAFAAWVTVRDGFNLLGVQTLNARVFEPSDPLLQELQAERRLSLRYLGESDPGRLRELDAQRARTDETATALWRSVQDWRTEIPASEELMQRLGELKTELDQIGQVRADVSRKTIDRTATLTAYDEAVDAIFAVFDALGGLDDDEIAKDTAALIDLNRSRELLSQQDALITGAIAANRITVAEQTAFARLVGAQWFLADRTARELAPTDRARFERMVEGDAFQQLQTLQDRVLAAKGADVRPPVTAAAWQAAAEQAMADLRGVILAGGEDIVSRAMPVAIGVIVRLVLAAGLGLLAVIASVVVSITTARSLVRQLERLREAAFNLAHERLPSVVERLGRGDEVDVAREAPPLQFGDDEIGQVGKAFNVVQETAVRTAVEQAELRRSVRDVFLSLARRTQALVHRQLTLLDAMERREHDAEELEDLFRVDHLATRMRRNAENLIVLSGSTPGRAWRRNVPMVDVVRGAVAEVEDYTRVTVRPLGEVSLTGRAVGDVIHLLAELIENGLSFSPPQTTVEVRGQLVANGFAIEIEDRGLGMSPDELAAANARIVDRSELNLADAARLGLFVVSRLTERHGVKVQLKESAYGGTTAVVLIPRELITADGADAAEALPAPGTALPVAPAPDSVRSTPAGDGPAIPSGPDGAAEPDQPAEPAPQVPEPVTRAPRLTPSGLPARTRKRQPAVAGPTTELAVVERRPAATTDAAEASPATEPETEAETTPVTDAGLPVRVRQASLAPELRHDQTEADDDAADDDTARAPEQVRRMMSSYQSGTRRGRTDAARLLGGAQGAGGAPADADEQVT